VTGIRSIVAIAAAKGILCNSRINSQVLGFVHYEGILVRSLQDVPSGRAVLIERHNSDPDVASDSCSRKEDLDGCVSVRTSSERTFKFYEATERIRMLR